MTSTRSRLEVTGREQVHSEQFHLNFVHKSNTSAELLSFIWLSTKFGDSRKQCLFMSKTIILKAGFNYFERSTKNSDWFGLVSCTIHPQQRLSVTLVPTFICLSTTESVLITKTDLSQKPIICWVSGCRRGCCFNVCFQKGDIYLEISLRVFVQLWFCNLERSSRRDTWAMYSSTERAHLLKVKPRMIISFRRFQMKMAASNRKRILTSISVDGSCHISLSSWDQNLQFVLEQCLHQENLVYPIL